jgi:PAS domain S-box-containing protein
MNDQAKTDHELDGRVLFLKTFIAAGVLTALGYLGNVTSLPVAFSVSFLFGSIFVIIAVSFFGPLLGGLSALIASSYTFILWNHPYAIIIFVCEALWMGLFLKRKYTNIVLIDAAYWLVIGLPLVFIFYFGVMSLGLQSTAIIFLKQSINGIINALIAGILINHLPWQKWFHLPAARRTVPYNQIIFQLTSAFLMLPLVGMMLFTNYQESKTIQTVAGELLVSESREANDLIHSWLERHIVAVKTIAKLGKDHHFHPSEKLQGALEQINSLFPDIHAVFIADNTATTIAFFPAINERGDSTIGINFSDREWFKQLGNTLKPVISDVFQSRASVFVPIFTISVPIVEEGKLSGFGNGVANLDKMRNVLSQSTHGDNLVFTVVDQHNNIVCSTNLKNQSLTPIKQKSGGQTLMIGKDFGLWTPSSKNNISIMDVWKDATYFVTLPIAGTTWTLLTEAPVAPLQGYLYQATIVNLALIFSLFVVAIILSQILSKLLVRTPVRLAAISRDIPEKLGKSVELIWPESNIAEMHLLIENFRETTQALDLQYQNIKDTNIHLEERVQERTTELRDSEERFDLAINGTGAGLWDWDMVKDQVVYSAQWKRMLGYEDHEVENAFSGWKNLWHPDDCASIEKALDDHLAGKADYYEIIHRLRHKDGSWRWILTRGDIVKDAQGKPCRWVGTNLDISAQQQVEEALRKSETSFRTLIENSFDVIFTLDTGGTFLFVSPAWERHFGYPASEVIGNNFASFVHPDDVGACIEYLMAVLGTGQSGTSPEYRVKHADGSWRCFIANGSPYVDLKGQRQFMGNGRDITERKLMEEEREKIEDQNRQLQKAESLGRMAGAIAHTFNNQLGVVIGNLELALIDLSQGAKPVNSLTTAMRAAGKAAAVSGQMLTYLGQSFDKREPLDLSDACRKSLPMLQAIMPGNVVLETDLPSPGPSIIANAIEIQQVLTNLITNAWEAVGAGRGSIHLRVKTTSLTEIPIVHRNPIDWQPQDNAYACLEVTDNGCGIADKNIEKLFDPFFTSKFTGRGLGLPMVLGIVKAHSGSVTMESEPGRGSTFRAFFPVSAEEVPQQPDKDVQPSSIEAGGTVLLVEDEEMVRNMAAAMLNRLGFLVLEAKDGVEAVEVFRQRQDEIRLVLSDLTMPRMDGWETLTALRKLAPDIPVILASGYDKAQVMSGDHPELPQTFLGKPYRLKELSNAIRQALVRRN